MPLELESMQPRALWKHFDMVRSIPHGSGNVGTLGRAIVKLASAKGLVSKTDSAGNVLVNVPAAPGREESPTVVLQAHLDMVCEKNRDFHFDFESQGIELVREGDWLGARETTLGADNGVGVAAALAFVENPGVRHGPLELLFTADEEIGLVGAMLMKDGFFTGETVLNLDGEEEGVFWFGCAGGMNAHIDLPLVFKPTARGLIAAEVAVGGLRGGHSGLDIHENRANALKLLGRTLLALLDEFDIDLAAVSGGDKSNAIPREARAIVFHKPGQADRIAAACERCLGIFKDRFGPTEPGLYLKLNEAAHAPTALEKTSAKAAVDLLCSMPHGVQAMHRDIPDTVETSINLASARTAGAAFQLTSSLRSTSAARLQGLEGQIASIADLRGASLRTDMAYPGWRPNPDSVLLSTAMSTWTGLFGTEASARVVHGGLECGVLIGKVKNIDIVSFGPRIENPHSPKERVSISSVGRFFKFLGVLLEALSAGA